MARTNRTDSVHHVREVSFEVSDARGRVVGAQIRTFASDFTEAPADQFWGYVREPGVYFGYRPHATRNGYNYGASQRDRFFATADERDAAVEKYLADARKRAEKAAQA